ncbi:MAG: di-heme oxidoredictase family protein [Candidatus Binatia bacterium]
MKSSPSLPRLILSLSVALLAITVAAGGQATAAESPNIGPDRITHEQILSGDLSVDEIRRAGLLAFTTPFNKLDGYGDGPIDPADTISPGGRPTLDGNGTFLRVNGLDAQTCLECHSIISNATIPATLGIGGVGGSNSNAIIQPTFIDPADLEDLDGAAGFDGRFANPPFIFGAGGVELLALEMTEDLQALKRQALANPGVRIALRTKGVDFGTIVSDSQGRLDTSGLAGVATDLVVRPFGRKGEFATTRDFDMGAMQFHFGMQPVEVVGEGIDADGDGVMNEILVGELSALQVFVLTSPRPRSEVRSLSALRGADAFDRIGCANCHRQSLDTRNSELPLRFPADPVAPHVNVYTTVDLTHRRTGFDRNRHGGVNVPLFSDLKRYDMGDALAESFSLVDAKTNREYITARLWGIADTAPYLHDGRATTLGEAILLHGGEGKAARDGYAGLDDDARTDVLAYLQSLRVPSDPFEDLLRDLQGGQRAGRGHRHRDRRDDHHGAR